MSEIKQAVQFVISDLFSYLTYMYASVLIKSTYIF